MRWKSRTTAFMICFAIGLLAAFIYAVVLGLFSRRHRQRQSPAAVVRCDWVDHFSEPEEVLSALKSPEVNVRREMFKRLFLRPATQTTYYDYARDLNYPERAERARLERVQLDDSPDTEAVLTFVRFEHPVALVFKKEFCGWQLMGALSSWLRFEDYPYENWISLPEAIRPGVHDLLVRDSTSDATSYTRKARLLRLDNGLLKQVAELDEETIEPVKDYQGADWSDVKHRRVYHSTFLPEQAGRTAGIESEVTDEVIKLVGPAPTFTYWSEVDGSWHAQQRNWSARPQVRVKLLGTTKKQLVWSKQEGRFVDL